MYDGAQALEKNHFPALQNRATHVPMHVAPLHEQVRRRRARLLLILMAAAIAAATLAPVAVLAG